jgi:asparaginyl-tRNA synthetase
MIEPEVAFNDLDDNMDLAEDFIKYVMKYTVTNVAEDLKFLKADWPKKKNQNQLPNEAK